MIARALTMAKAATTPPNRSKYVRKPPKRGGIPRWMSAIGVLGVVVIAAHFYIVSRINRSIDAVSAAATGMLTISHRGGYYTWDGDFGVRRLRIENADASVIYLTIDALELNTPGWGWTLQMLLLDLGFGRNRPSGFGVDAPQLPDADELGLTMIGFDFDVNSLMPPGMPSMSFASAAVFETEGCTNSRYWVPLNLRNDLGLPYQRVDLSFGYRKLAPNMVGEYMELNSPGLSSIRFEREALTSTPESYFNGGFLTAKTKRQRWTIDDQGFLAARNRYCSEQSKIDEDEFLRRHLTAVRRVLQVFGIQPSPETEVIYADFVRQGGRLEIEAEPTLELDAKLISQYQPAQLWEIYNARIRHDEAAFQPMALQFITPRPLPRAYSGSVYDLIARNADTGAGNASPMAGLSDRLLATLPSNKQDEAESAPAAPPPPTPVVPAAPRPTKPQQVAIGIDTGSLTANIGKRVQIKTTDGKTRIGVLIDVGPKTLTISVKVGGGNADLSYARERITGVEINPPGR